MRWAQGLLRLFAIQMRQVGQISPQALLVSNHISWLDIFVISAAQATCFVAKAEIRHWPLAGWLCAQVDTLFIERSSRRQAQHIAHAMAERLAADKSVAFFPEGTTSDGGSLLPFHAALFQPAISLQASVQPLLIRYLDADGQRSTATAFIGEMSFLDSLRATLSTRNLRVELICLPVESSQQHDRRSLARTCQEAISQHAKVLQKN